jgi:hypothetical protein
VDEDAGPTEGESSGRPSGTGLRNRNKTPSSGSACSSCEDSSDQGESDGAEAASARKKSSAGKFAAHCCVVLTASFRLEHGLGVPASAQCGLGKFGGV